MAEIKISSKETSDQVLVKSTFNYEIPEALDSAVATFGEKYVYDMFKGAFTIALQAPGRKELVEQWDSIPADVRDTLTTNPDGENKTPFAELPVAQQELLQQYMGAGKPGEPRSRMKVIRSIDPVKDLMAMWGSLSDERKAELQAMFSGRS